MKKTIESWFGQVDCATESYDIIQQTLAAPINEGLQSMMEKDLATGKTHDGRLLVRYDQVEKIDAKYAFAGEEKGDRGELPFRFFISGDLSFFACLLGKDGSSGCYCYVCDLTQSQWQEEVHEKGGLWSLQTMQEIRSSEMDARKARGIKKTPLITCVDVDRYSLPLLHMMMGQGNKLLDSFLDYVDKFPQLEDTPIELKGIRNDFYHALQKRNDAKETHEVFAQLMGTRLATVRLARSVLIKHMASKGKKATPNEKLLDIEDKTRMTVEIDNLMRDKKQVDSDLKNESAKLSEARKMLYAAEARYSKKDRWLRQVIEEEFLIPKGIVRGAYHGGDLTGGAVKKLMEHSGEIFRSLQLYLVPLAREKGVPQKFLVELDERIRVTQVCLTSFDGLYSRLRCGSIDDVGFMDDVEGFLRSALKSWRLLGLSISPKVHLLEDHVIDFLHRENGLSHHDEEFVERAHQKGLKFNQMTRRNMRDAVSRYKFLSRVDYTANKYDIAKIQGSIKDRRKRDMSGDRQTKKQKCKMEREESRATGVMEVDVLDPGHRLMNIEEINLASLQQDDDSDDGESDEDENGNNDHGE